MKTAEEWFQELTRSYREDAMRHLYPAYKSRKYPSLHTAITLAFTWQGTFHGQELWKLCRNDAKSKGSLYEIY